MIWPTSPGKILLTKDIDRKNEILQCIKISASVNNFDGMYLLRSSNS